ncbi:MAG TPA: hypothetical protein VHW69_08850 [Rhizomicrobium sp.]|jgi:hypothetical protein|nr:hypothetical protein [Rhizomicrobium sp.]
MKVGRQVERWQSADGKHLLRVFTRGPGCFYFVELSELSEKDETFWTTTRTSEEHASLEDARNAALLQLPWLKDLL